MSGSHAYDVVVVGAGPAGMAAALETARAGLSTLVLDENAGPGGQIYRAALTTPLSDDAILGRDYAAGRSLVAEFARGPAEFVAGATVWSLNARREVAYSLNGRSRRVAARQVILASGAQERPMPFPGWTLPGIMTIGAAQTMLKASGLVPDGKVVLAGQGPLLWLYAAQNLRAGGAITAILDTTPRGAALSALARAPGFLISPYFAKGLSLLRYVRARIPVMRGIVGIEARGEGKLAEVVFRRARGQAQSLKADTLLIHMGVVPQTNLAMAAGIAHEWDELSASWRPRLTEDGATNIPGIAIAGDGGGIIGAEASAASGRLAGLSVIAALGASRPGYQAPPRQTVLASLRRALRGRAFLDHWARPPTAFRVPPDDATLICRCEAVSAGALRTAINQGISGPNQAKAMLRCGMGPCQGRLCSLTVTEIIAAARGLSPGEIGHYRARAPVKPVTLGELADLTADAERAFRRHA